MMCRRVEAGLAVAGDQVLQRRQCSQNTIVSEGFKGGTRGAPIMPRDAVSRTANVGTVGKFQYVYMIKKHETIRGDKINYHKFDLKKKT